jgi:hypothetical protein
MTNYVSARTRSGTVPFPDLSKNLFGTPIRAGEPLAGLSPGPTTFQQKLVTSFSRVRSYLTAQFQKVELTKARAIRMYKISGDPSIRT